MRSSNEKREAYYVLGLAKLRQLLRQLFALEKLNGIHDEDKSGGMRTRKHIATSSSSRVKNSANWIEQVEELYTALSLELPTEFRQRPEILRMRAELYAEVGFSPSCAEVLQHGAGGGPSGGASASAFAGTADGLPGQEEGDDSALDTRSTSAIATLKGKGKLHQRKEAALAKAASNKAITASGELSSSSSSSASSSSTIPPADQLDGATSPAQNSICCKDSILGTNSGCLSTALALYKFAENLEEEADLLYEKAIEQGFSAWKSYFQTCEIFLPFLFQKQSSQNNNLAWDRKQPEVADLVAVLEKNKVLLSK